MIANKLNPLSGDEKSEEATFNIPVTVTAINDAPVAQNTTVQTTGVNQAAIALIANDTDGGTGTGDGVVASFKVVTLPLATQGGCSFDGRLRLPKGIPHPGTSVQSDLQTQRPGSPGQHRSISHRDRPGHRASYVVWLTRLLKHLSAERTILMAFRSGPASEHWRGLG